jgi:hypothetical protein
LKQSQPERVARADRPDDREEPLEDSVVERNGDEAQDGDGAQAHDHLVRVRRSGELERPDDPFLVGHDEEERCDRRPPDPVQDDEDTQDDESDGQRGRRGNGLRHGHLHIEYQYVIYR